MATERQWRRLLLQLTLLAALVCAARAFNFGNFGGERHEHEEAAAADVDFYESMSVLPDTVISQGDGYFIERERADAYFFHIV